MQIKNLSIVLTFIAFAMTSMASPIPNSNDVSILSNDEGEVEVPKNTDDLLKYNVPVDDVDSELENNPIVPDEPATTGGDDETNDNVPEPDSGDEQEPEPSASGEEPTITEDGPNESGDEQEPEPTNAGEEPSVPADEPTEGGEEPTDINDVPSENEAPVEPEAPVVPPNVPGDDDKVIDVPSDEEPPSGEVFGENPEQPEEPNTPEEPEEKPKKRVCVVRPPKTPSDEENGNVPSDVEPEEPTEVEPNVPSTDDVPPAPFASDDEPEEPTDVEPNVPTTDEIPPTNGGDDETPNDSGDEAPSVPAEVPTTDEIPPKGDQDNTPESGDEAPSVPADEANVPTTPADEANVPTTPADEENVPSEPVEGFNSDDEIPTEGDEEQTEGGEVPVNDEVPTLGDGDEAPTASEDEGEGSVVESSTGNHDDLLKYNVEVPDDGADEE